MIRIACAALTGKIYAGKINKAGNAFRDGKQDVTVDGVPKFEIEVRMAEPDRSKPPCLECGAMTEEEAETKCICAGDKDHCHGCDLWP